MLLERPWRLCGGPGTTFGTFLAAVHELGFSRMPASIRSVLGHNGPTTALNIPQPLAVYRESLYEGNHVPDSGPGTIAALPHLILKTLLRVTDGNYTCFTDEETGSERLSYQLRMHSSEIVELDLKAEALAINLDFRKHREGRCRGQRAAVIGVAFSLLCWAQP